MISHCEVCGQATSMFSCPKFWHLICVSIHKPLVQGEAVPISCNYDTGLCGGWITSDLTAVPVEAYAAVVSKLHNELSLYIIKVLGDDSLTYFNITKYHNIGFIITISL